MRGHGRPDRSDLNLERLEKRRQLLNERLELRRLRINEQLDRKEAQLSKRLNRKQEEIVAAALVLLDKDGLTSLSLRKLALTLDMQAPGLYWHFKNKEMLIDYLAEAILQSEFNDLEPRREAELWQDWLSNTMNRLRSALLAHQDGARVVAGAHFYPAVSLAKLIETSISSLHLGGLSLIDGRHVIMTTLTYTFGFVIEEQSGPSINSLGEALDDLRKDYPYIAKSIDAVKKSNPDDYKSYEFNAGLQLIIGGVKSNPETKQTV